MRVGDPFVGRASGHRGRRYLWERHEIIELESPTLRMRVIASRGADIQELLHKPTDTELLWAGHDRIRRGVQGPATSALGQGVFLDHFSGGWQSVVPSAQFPVSYRGASLGQHGEAALAEWDVDVLVDSEDEIRVAFSTSLLRTPLAITKTMSLSGSVLSVEEAVTNHGSSPIEMQWGHHISLSGSFVKPGTRILMRGAPDLAVPEGDGSSYRFQGSKKPWPEAVLRDGGPADFSLVPQDDGTDGIGVAGPMQAGEVSVSPPGTGPGLTLSWDAMQFPYCWMWLVLGGYEDWPLWGQYRLLTIEPFTSELVSLDEAIAREQAVVLQPEECRSSKVEVTVNQKPQE